MKKFSWITVVFCCVLLIGCDKNSNNDDVRNEKSFALKNGSIVVTNYPDIGFKTLNEFPEGVSTDDDFIASRKRSLLKSTSETEDDGTDGLRGYDYRFKLVGEASALKIGGETTQATHVKITDDAKYAFVSYNTKGASHKGGVVVYRIDLNQAGSLEDVSATVTPVSKMEMPKAEVSAVDYVDGKLYIAGASEDPEFGYEEDSFDYAFFGVMELNSDFTFKDAEPLTTQALTSFQATSIRVAAGKVYITTGDAANGTEGGLYIIDAGDYENLAFIGTKDHARSVDISDNHIFLMQAEPARVTRYDLNGLPDSGNEIYLSTNEATQKDAKSEILAWNDYLFVAMNESGLRMLDENGTVVDRLDPPGSDSEKHVTNSVALNSDIKKNLQGTDVRSNLLLLANGEKGIYWYDIMDVNGKDKIVLCNNNSILAGEGLSANFIASKGNIVFVANGEGGLKVLYIGFNEGLPPPPPPLEVCTDVTHFFSDLSSFFPEQKSVFRIDAVQAVKTLFSDRTDIINEIEVLEKTNLYINYIISKVSYKNSLGYFVVPGLPDGSRDPMTNDAYFKANIYKEGEFYTTNSNRVKILNKEKYGLFYNIPGVVQQGTWQIENYLTGDGSFNKGDRVVLFLVPNGWKSQNSTIELETVYGQTIFMDYDMNRNNVNFMNLAAGNAYNKPNIAPDDFKGVQLNSFYSEACKSIVLFFEDIYNFNSDMDFNDVIFAIYDDTITDPNRTEILKIKKPKYTVDEEENISLTQ
jgi:hypothetical protein